MRVAGNGEGLVGSAIKIGLESFAATITQGGRRRHVRSCNLDRLVAKPEIVRHQKLVDDRRPDRNSVRSAEQLVSIAAERRCLHEADISAGIRKCARELRRQAGTEKMIVFGGHPEQGHAGSLAVLGECRNELLFAADRVVACRSPSRRKADGGGETTRRVSGQRHRCEPAGRNPDADPLALADIGLGGHESGDRGDIGCSGSTGRGVVWIGARAIILGPPAPGKTIAATQESHSDEAAPRKRHRLCPHAVRRRLGAVARASWRPVIEHRKRMRQVVIRPNDDGFELDRR